jgi:hypothetical protein
MRLGLGQKHFFDLSRKQKLVRKVSRFCAKCRVFFAKTFCKMFSRKSQSDEKGHKISVENNITKGEFRKKLWRKNEHENFRPNPNCDYLNLQVIQFDSNYSRFFQRFVAPTIVLSTVLFFQLFLCEINSILPSTTV